MRSTEEARPPGRAKKFFIDFLRSGISERTGFSNFIFGFGLEILFLKFIILFSGDFARVWQFAFVFKSAY